ncbi:MAG: riboflavin biosynthesis protein RibD [Actinobacteria bacterium HGW-Actinobacteria-6]|nr:MAG: riboflavin biosynthesis protein RibD [Actinobacteria bacterium HGW-Actinobacteria-6]
MSLFSDDASVISEPFLRRAFALAESGRGSVSPNPMVGCVVVRDGVVVGEGHHERVGSAHAEVNALAAAGESAKGATVYVTLEPCTHYGRTPPCTAALIKAGVSKVVIGMRDPNVDVSGGGAEILAHAGVDVEFAANEAPFRALNETWLHRLHTSRPWVRVKVALTLDGRPTLFASQRSRITGSGGSSVTMELRARATAVAVGASTLGIDNPLLTVRDDQGRGAVRQPIRVVLARTSVPSPAAKIFSADPTATRVVVSDAADARGIAALERADIPVLRYRYADGITGSLRVLSDSGIDDVLIEAGPALASAFWNARLIDELVVVHAGGMGGNAAPPLFLGGPDASAGDLVPSMRAVEAAIRADDAITVWRHRREAGATSITGRSS